ncbi:hypothetical protein C8Q75DRAFT_794985 [Abortiporus biennis]|nr:hypothetical protein C8Q75DRAFT_794985 [Abortiporus biennis]
MADAAALQTLTSTLATLAAEGSQHNNGQPQHPDPNAHLQPGLPGVITPGPNGEMPVKRRPGRPKGSGKKPIDPNSEPKIKRPVGRPRKDGLPAGSVGPKRPGRPRKRPPGNFASGTPVPSPGVYPYPPTFGDQWPASISAPPMASLSRAPTQISFPIDPTLDRDNWADMVRQRPDIFLHTLVASLSAPNPVSVAGPSVEEAFRAHLVSLAPSQKNAGTPPIPTLYSILKTFWLPSSPVYFSLTASAAAARIPSEHRFLYWDPQPLVFNGIACPVCTNPLANNGRISSGPLKIYDLGKPFFVIGCEYICRSSTCCPNGQEGRKFASTDASILRALPAKLKDEFPARLLEGAGPNPDLGSGPEVWSWRGMGVSTSLWNMVRACLRAGLRKDAILGIIRGIVDGVPEDPVPGWPGYPPPGMTGPDGEDEGEEGDEEEEVNGNLHGDKDVAPDEFTEAWNAHNGGIEPNAEAGPSHSNGHLEQQQQHQSQPPPQQQQQAQPPASTSSESPLSAQPAPVPHSDMISPYPPNPHTPYLQYPYPPPYGYFPPPPPPPAPTIQPVSTLKRTFSVMEGQPQPVDPLQKRIRHCVKCGSHECKGKGGRAFCSNPCQDCGKMECKGRNSKRPDRTCVDAWP